MKNYNGQIQNVRRRYDSLRNFVGRNEVHKRGDILCVSTNNDDVYDLLIDADGISTFIQLYKKYKNGDQNKLPNDSVGSEQIENDSVQPEDLDPALRKKIEDSNISEEDKQAIDELKNAEDITEDTATDMWDEALRNAGLTPVNDDQVDDDI